MKSIVSIIILVFSAMITKAQDSTSCGGMIYLLRNNVIYEKIENELFYSCLRPGYTYKVQQEYCRDCITGKIWIDSITGVIKIKTDTSGTFKYKFITLKNDIAIDSSSRVITALSLPVPYVKFYKVHSNTMAKSQISDLGDLVCVTKDFPYHVKYEIKSFHLTIITENSSIIEFKIIGPNLSLEVLNELAKCKSGSKIIIDNIQATRLIDLKAIKPEPKVIEIN